MKPLAICLLGLCALLVPCTCQEWCVALPPSDFGELTQLYECSSVPPFLLAYLWSPVQLSVQCSSNRVRSPGGDRSGSARI